MTNWVRRREVQYLQLEGGNERKKVAPGILKCECGNEVTISHDGVECSKCGQPYNLFGQRLRRGWSWSDEG